MADAPKNKTRAEALLDKLWNDQSVTGQGLRKAAKDMFPDIVIPEDTAAIAVAPLKAELDDTKQKLEKALERITARERADDDLQAENALSVKLQSAKREFGLTDAGFDKMVARMKETGNVTDASAAAAWVHTQMPKQEPVNSPTWLPSEANFFGSQKKDEAFEALHQNPQKYADDQLREFAKDPDKYVRETFPELYGNA